MVSLKAGDRELDRKYQRFGWREFKLRGRDLLLNGSRIELRGDITSESLSYIHLALEVMEKCAAKNSKLSDLQPVADYMMSFWGTAMKNEIVII